MAANICQPIERRENMAEFNNEMVILARESRGYSQRELCEPKNKLLNFSQALLSKIEQGLVIPEKEIVNELANVLEYTPNFFYDNGRLCDPVSDPVNYRKKSQVPKKVLREVLAKACIARLHIKKLCNLDKFDDWTNKPEIFYSEVDTDKLNLNQIHEVAQKARDYFGYSHDEPITNLMASVESKKIFVHLGNYSRNEKDIACNDVDGFNFFDENSRLSPVIFLNGSFPADRVKFSLAHELGHLFMHRRKGDKIMEEQANKFASEFLLPAKYVKKDLEKLSFSKLKVLKEKWQVSMAALLMKATDLGTLSPNQARYLWCQLAPFRKKEPIEINEEKPSLLQNILNTNQISTKDLKDLFHMSLDEIKLSYKHTLSFA